MTPIARNIVYYFGRYDRMVSVFGVIRKAINLGDDFAHTPLKWNSTT